MKKSSIHKKIEELIKQSKILEDGISRYSLEVNSLIDIIEDATTLSMFTDKKIVIVEEASIFSTSREKKEPVTILEDYINNYNEDTIMIFSLVSEKIDSRKKITKLLEKNGEIIEIDKENQKKIGSFITSYLEKDGYKIEGLDVNYLKVRLGTDIENVENELDKLKLYKIDSKVITREDVDAITMPTFEDEIFALTDAVIKNDVTKSLDLLGKFLERNYEEIQIVIMLANQFRFLYQVKALNNKGNSFDKIASILGANPYRVKISLQNSYCYSLSDLLSYLRKLADLDEGIKLGKIDKRLGLELFLIKKDMVI